jgi:phosphate transport system permease protein
MMILPTIALTAQAALAGVPAELGQGAAALGLRRDAVLLRVALPAARRGILAGIVLALGRAAGETMAVVMVAGNVVQWPDSVFAPVRTLTANIALEMGYATDRHRSVLFLGGLLLLAMVLLFAWSAARIARRRLA